MNFYRKSKKINISGNPIDRKSSNDANPVSYLELVSACVISILKSVNNSCIHQYLCFFFGKSSVSFCHHMGYNFNIHWNYKYICESIGYARNSYRVWWIYNATGWPNIWIWHQYKDYTFTHIRRWQDFVSKYYFEKNLYYSKAKQNNWIDFSVIFRQ